MSNKQLFNDPNAFTVRRELAVQHGLTNAIIYVATKNQQTTDIKKLKEILPFISTSTIKRSMDYLIRKGLFSKNQMSYEEIKEELLLNNDLKRYECNWCKQKVLILHQHHFPIPKRNGGKETVDICPNCHYGFHHIEHNKQIKGD